MARVSIVIVSFHTGPSLFHTIALAQKQLHYHELILVDNGNTAQVAATLRKVAKADKRIRIVAGHGNIGFSAGCNLGAKRAKGEYLLFLNPDCLLPQPDTLEECIVALDDYPKAMLAGANLRNPDDTEQRGSRRELLTPVTAISEALGLHRFFKVKRLNVHESESPEDVQEVPAISGAFMFMRRRDYEKLGGFDEGFFLHVEDLDFCKRVNDAGGKVIWVPRAKAVHMLSTSEAPSNFIEGCKAKGFIRYFHKHFTRRFNRPLLWVADIGIWLRYMLKCAKSSLHAYDPPGPAEIAGQRLMVLLDATDAKPVQGYGGQTIGVTGASSPVALMAIGRLLASGAKVIATARSPKPMVDLPELIWLQTDFTSADFKWPEPLDAIIHCAPLWTLPQTLSTAANSRAQRIVAFGSTSLFSKKGSNDAYEKSVVTQLRDAEHLVKEVCPRLGLPFTILRPTMIYGAGLDGNVTRIARTIRKFGMFPIAPPARGLRQPVHAADLAEAALLSLRSELAENKVYNVSGAEVMTYRDMIVSIFHALKKRPRLIPLSFLPQALDAAGKVLHISGVNGEMARRMNMDLAFPHQQAAEDFGYKPRAFLSAGVADIEGVAA